MSKPEKTGGLKVSGLKRECFECRTFDTKQRGSYKCAVAGHCPGVDWNSEHKQQAINRVIKRGVMRV